MEHDIEVKYDTKSKLWEYTVTYVQLELVEGDEPLRLVRCTTGGSGLENLQRAVEQDSVVLGDDLWDVLREAESVDRRPVDEDGSGGDG